MAEEGVVPSGDRLRLIMRFRTAAIVAGLLAVAGIVGYVAIARPDPSTLTGLGYPGITILMFISSGSIVLPAPGFAAVLAASPTLSLNPIFVGLFAGLGAATGELTGYLVGTGGGKVLSLGEISRWRRAQEWLQHHGFFAVLALASIPNPFFDLIGVAAGSLAYPVQRFWVACLLGNSMKYVAMAFVGETAMTWWIGR